MLNHGVEGEVVWQFFSLSHSKVFRTKITELKNENTNDCCSIVEIFAIEIVLASDNVKFVLSPPVSLLLFLYRCQISLSKFMR